MATKKRTSKVKPIGFPAGDAKFQALVVRTHSLMFDHIGDLPELESAIGFMFLGYYFGWKVLHVIHSKKTVAKYEKLLGIRVRTEFPETGPYAGRSVGWVAIKKVSNFWKAISGEVAAEVTSKDRPLVN